MASSCQSSASREEKKKEQLNCTSFSLKVNIYLGNLELQGSQIVELLLNLIECAVLLWEQSIFPKLLFSAVCFPPLMCQAGVSSQPLDFGSQVHTVNSLQISIWVSQSQAFELCQSESHIYISFSCPMVNELN
jgi:hypothetical protein